MLSTKLGLFSAKKGFSRAGVSAVLLLCLLFSLANGATQALCLEVGGECSPSSAVPAGPCHDQVPDNSPNPACGSCIDILVPEDSSARCNLPDGDLEPSAAEHSVAAAGDTLTATADALPANAETPLGGSPLHPFIRCTVLRI